MKQINTIAFVLDRFELRTPGQQVLDRFLINFRGSHRVVAFCPPNEDIHRRVQQFGLTIAKSLPEAVRDADAIFALASDELLQKTIAMAKKDAAVFVYGSVPSAALVQASQRGMHLASGTAALTLLRLPALENPKPSKLLESLIVIPAETLNPELTGLDGLFSFFDATATEVWPVSGDFWSAIPVELLHAALSRTDNPRGHAIEDGRTEDLVPLHNRADLRISPLDYLKKLSKSKRAFQLQHRKDFRSTILIIDGVVGDINVAFRMESGFCSYKFLSTQLFRSPTPQEEHYTRFASAILQFFQTGKVPWSPNRTVFASKLMTSISDWATHDSSWNKH